MIGDAETDHDDWRRERVRSLLGYLVVHPDATREAVMAALWPEATEEAARRSLRSTLNLLLGVLEEGRTGGDAAYFVRADSTRIPPRRPRPPRRGRLALRFAARRGDPAGGRRGTEPRRSTA